MKSERKNIFKTFSMNGKSYTLNITPQLKTLFLILGSNLLFFILFFPSPQEEVEMFSPDHIEVKIPAKLMTPFQNGKKVTLHHSNTNKNINAQLTSPPDEEGLVTVATDVESAKTLLTYQDWKIIPPIKLQITLNGGENREIRY